MGVENQTLAVSFTTLCVDARSQHDYIALSRLFHTVMLFDVPVMTRLMESEARRFIALVDEFYAVSYTHLSRAGKFAGRAISINATLY